MESNRCYLSVFEQNSEHTAHIAHVKMSNCCEEKKPDIILPGFWPPNGPHLCPIDYQIQTTILKRVFYTDIQIIDELKQRLIQVWCNSHQDTRADLRRPRGPCPQDAKHCATWQWNNTMLVHCNKSATNGIKLCFHFHLAFNVRLCTFKKCFSFCSGDSVPQATCWGFALDPTAE